ncbi:DUF6113 family protein [Herbiconiux sp. CPCC 205716]|uniref:DUF6113 family protein n=1 Tax=Herbiconiux gentiana TaxID=2970912 RepID=A0ABT2GG99_9MICO|nr:DUF6113 family protein [Herbiconiux gentiana]MCS5715250.1 DUF6113 family protein [Herbiconiux gentiana]
MLPDQPAYTPACGSAAPVHAPAAPGDELGTSRGSRILGYIAALLLGALFGAIGTVVHQIDVSVFGLFDLPVGLILALVAIGLLLTGLRLIAPSRLAAMLAAAALIGVVALLTLESPGGSVLVPAGTVGLVWLFGSTLIAVVVIAWPRLAARRRPVATGGPVHPDARPDAVDSTW